MANIRDSLSAIEKIEGVEAAVLVDLKSGQAFANEGCSVDVELEASANADLMKTKDKIIRLLGYHDGVEDMVITTWKHQIMLRRVVTENTFGQDLMLFIKLKKCIGGMGVNQAMIRILVKQIERDLIY